MVHKPYTWGRVTPDALVSAEPQPYQNDVGQETARQRRRPPAPRRTSSSPIPREGVPSAQPVAMGPRSRLSRPKGSRALTAGA
jgi:hypothetical protein